MKATTTLATGKTPDGSKLVLQEHDGQFYLRINGITLMSTIASASEQMMAEVSCGEMTFEKPRILIGGLGFGYTLKSVLEIVNADARVVVAELLPEVVAWNREYLADVNGALLDDPRTDIREDDVYNVLKASSRNLFHAILFDVDNSPDPLVQRGNARLYSKKGLELIKSSLHPGGRVVFWSAHRDTAFKRSLERTFKRVDAMSAKAYPKAKKATHTLFVAER